MSTLSSVLFASSLPFFFNVSGQEPEGTVAAKPASEGKTEIEGQGKFAAAKPIGTEETEADTDATQFEVSAGGFLSTGNARALSLTGATRFRLRRDIHEVLVVGAGNYGRAAVDTEAEPEVTVGNAQGRVRYDVYFAKRWSAFLMTTARHDPFLGLRLRLNIDPGVAFHILTQPKHRLWVEAGYDFQYDLRTEDALYATDENGDFVVDEDGDRVRDEAIARSQNTHAARLFAGYSNRLNEHVTFDTGLEYLQSLLDARRWRLNWDLSLTTQLAQKFSLATTFTMRIDNDPLPDVKKIDTITSLNLVYTFF